MKTNPVKFIISLILILIASCDEPETVVTDIVHPDGSVTRKLEMRNTKNNFKVSVLQVPFDSTWTIKDSLEISEKGDTTWIKRAEKLFKNVDAINLEYKTDSGANRKAVRNAEFKRRFRWFDTEYRFAETIDKQLKYGYPVSQFLDSAQLAWFYATDEYRVKCQNGADSVKYKTLEDSVNKRTDKWFISSVVSEWIGTFTSLTGSRAPEDLSAEALKRREPEFFSIIKKSGDKFDSLWKEGIILREFIGADNASRFRTEADSAVNVVTRVIDFSFKNYTQKILMPGKLIGTDGFLDSTGVLLWPVKSDYFFTEKYVMWAESKTPNTWAWIISGIFLLFVLAGIIFRATKKG